MSGNDVTKLWAVDSLYSDRPLDRYSSNMSYWQIDDEAGITQEGALCVMPVAPQSCRCAYCLSGTESEVKLTRVDVTHQAAFSNENNGIRFPIEFTEVVAPKVITLHFRQDWNWPWEDDFDDVIDKHRLRTDHEHVHVNLFLADKKVEIEQDGGSGFVKVFLTVEAEVAVGDRVRLILQGKDEETGRWYDKACLEDAITNRQHGKSVCDGQGERRKCPQERMLSLWQGRKAGLPFNGATGVEVLGVHSEIPWKLHGKPRPPGVG